MITPAFAQLMLIMPFISNAFIYLQAYKIWKRQSHDDISFLTVIFSALTAAIWGYYGFLINSMPLVLSGIIATVGFILIVYLKLLIPSKTGTACESALSQDKVLAKTENGWRWV